jgi:hypothetical protein
MCLVNPLINFVFIPMGERWWHNAALGAASALVVTEVVMTLYGMATLRSTVRDRTLGRVAVGALIAGAAQGAVVWLTAGLWPLLGEALGVLVYIAVAIVLGALAREDVAVVYQTLRRRVARTA